MKKNSFGSFLSLFFVVGTGLVALGTVFFMQSNKDISIQRSKAANEDKLTVHTNQVQAPVTYRASGFIGDIIKASAPQNLISDIKVHFYRSSGYSGTYTPDFTPNFIYGPEVENQYTRIKQLGGTVQVILSHPYVDFFSAPNKVFPGDSGNWTGWENQVKAVIGKTKSLGYRVEYDIWNEPEFYFTPHRPDSQFYELWKRAYTLIRSLDPGSPIVGPSIAISRDQSNRGSFIHNFLLYAKQNNVLPDKLSWHDENGDSIMKNAASFRTWMSQNGISNLPIQINEVIGPDVQFNPGTHVNMMMGAEKAGIDAVARACWGDTPEANWIHCGDYTLNGILQADTFKPLSTWWVYKAYADMTGNIVSTEPSGNISGLASYNQQTKTMKILLATNNNQGQNITVSVDKPANLPNGTVIKKTGRLIPNRQRQPLEIPLTVFNDSMSALGSTYTISIPNLAPGDAFEVTVTFTAESAVLPTAESSNPSADTLTFGVAGDKPVVGNWLGGKTEYIGVVRGPDWFLKHSFTKTSFSDESFKFTLPGDVDYSKVVPLACDWDGSGKKKPVAFYKGAFYLRKGTGSDNAFVTVIFGGDGDIPVCGNWTASPGPQTVGVVRNGLWFLRKSNTNGNADISFAYGIPTDIPVVGKWTGGVTDFPGVFRNGHFLLRKSFTTGNSEIDTKYGNAGVTPIIGDWNGNGVSSVGYMSGQSWYFKNDTQ